ncbi:unnamed protein product [Sphagnum balticum]
MQPRLSFPIPQLWYHLHLRSTFPPSPIVHLVSLWKAHFSLLNPQLLIRIIEVPLVFVDIALWSTVPPPLLILLVAAIHAPQRIAHHHVLTSPEGRVLELHFSEEPEGPRAQTNGINKIFDLFDDDHTNTINSGNIKRVAKELGETMNIQELEEMLQRASSNGRQAIVLHGRVVACEADLGETDCLALSGGVAEGDARQVDVGVGIGPHQSKEVLKAVETGVADSAWAGAAGVGVAGKQL